MPVLLAQAVNLPVQMIEDTAVALQAEQIRGRVVDAARQQTQMMAAALRRLFDGRGRGLRRVGWN